MNRLFTHAVFACLAAVTALTCPAAGQRIDDNCQNARGDVVGTVTGRASSLITRNNQTDALNLSISWTGEVAGLLQLQQPIDTGNITPLDYVLNEDGSFEGTRDFGKFVIQGTVNATTCVIAGNWGWTSADKETAHMGTLNSSPSISNRSFRFRKPGARCAAR